MPLAPTEEKMWEESLSENPIHKMTTAQINDKYYRGEHRIVNQIGREKLPRLAEASKNPGYMNMMPLYPRKAPWDIKMQSRLIESFLINIPVPPIILYKKYYNSYEVIDGRQRIMTIRDFYANKLELMGLELWPELNGYTYQQLPATIKEALGRHSIPSIELITKSDSNLEETLFLKKIAFERLNTGRPNLSSQEVRNCVYYGKFSQLLLELANNTLFAKAWEIPIGNTDELQESTSYQKMEDTELILRFFALRHIDKSSQNMKDFLDTYMMRSMEFSDKDIETLRDIFERTIELAYNVYEDKLFKPFNVKTQTW
jgi:Protein of unknown function DUF262